MEYGICHISAAPLRAEPSDRSEMVSQLLFGDTYQVLARSPNEKWLHIRMAYDGYEGWSDAIQGRAIADTEFEILDTQRTYTLPLLSNIRTHNSVRQLSIASSLPHWQKGHLRLSDETLAYGGDVIEAFKKQSGAELCRLSLHYIGVPYLWGGRSAFGIDCSGFVQQVLKLGGIWLPRDASQQVKEGDKIKDLVGSRPGDLAFFVNEAGRTVHVGLILENNGIIHAHGEVRMDILDAEGIFRQEEKRYSHKLSEIRRM